MSAVSPEFFAAYDNPLLAGRIFGPAEGYRTGYQMMSLMFSTLGGAAVFLAVAGLYAVMAFSVSQRTREIGIRLALGADRGQ